MITGFNQDVHHEGKVFHVQTEDRGISNPLIETLIYVGGTILDSRRTSYERFVKDGKVDETKVAALLEKQHRQLVVEVKLGKFSKAPKKTLGDQVDNSHSLDEVILDYLASTKGEQSLQLQILSEEPMQAGAEVTLRALITRGVDHSPAPGAVLTAELVQEGGTALGLCEGKSDKKGEVILTIPVPADPPKRASIVLRVAQGGPGASESFLILQ